MPTAANSGEPHPLPPPLSGEGPQGQRCLLPSPRRRGAGGEVSASSPLWPKNLGQRPGRWPLSLVRLADILPTTEDAPPTRHRSRRWTSSHEEVRNGSQN